MCNGWNGHIKGISGSQKKKKKDISATSQSACPHKTPTLYVYLHSVHRFKLLLEYLIDHTMLLDHWYALECFGSNVDGVHGSTTACWNVEGCYR